MGISDDVQGMLVHNTINSFWKNPLGFLILVVFAIFS